MSPELFAWFAIGICVLWYLVDLALKRYRYPPGPIPYPLVGNLLQLNPDAPHETIYEWSKVYGGVFTVWMPKPNVVIADYELIKEALINKGDVFAGRYIGFIYGQLAPDPNGIGIILCENQKWREQRRFTLQVLRNLGFGRSVMEERIMQQTEQLIMRLKRRVRRTSIDPTPRQHHLAHAVVSLDIPLHLCVVNIINSVVMGTTWRDDDPRFFHLKKMISQQIQNVQSIGMLFVDAYPWLRYLPIPGKLGLTEYLSNQSELTRFFVRQVQEHKQAMHDGESQKDADLATEYLIEMDKRKDKGLDMGWFSEWQLMCILGDLWAAGMETTVTTLRWAILYMLHYTDIQKRCRTEIRREIGDRKVTMSDRLLLPYTLATLHEIQRHANIIPINIQHRVTDDVMIGDRRIRAGTTVIPQISAVHMNPACFPQPDKFFPERFLSDDGSRVVNTEKLIPFSLGKRQCLGEGLARMELFLIFTTLMQKFDFAALPDQDAPSLKPIMGMTMSPQPYECVISEVALDTIRENFEEPFARPSISYASAPPTELQLPRPQYHTQRSLYLQ